MRIYIIDGTLEPKANINCCSTMLVALRAGNMLLTKVAHNAIRLVAGQPGKKEGNTPWVVERCPFCGEPVIIRDFYQHFFGDVLEMKLAAQRRPNPPEHYQHKDFQDRQEVCS